MLTLIFAMVSRHLVKKIPKLAAIVFVVFVILVILGIVTGVFQLMWGTCCGGITCVSNPEKELATKMETAKNGIDAQTGGICMKAGERLTVPMRIYESPYIHFECFENDVVCSGVNPPITFPTPDYILANKDVKFKGIIHCEGPAANGNYDCTISIKSA